MIPVAGELVDVIAAVVPTGVAVSDYIPASPSTPSVWVGWPEFVDFTTGTLRGHKLFDIPITFCVGLGDGRTAQQAMGELLYGEIPIALQEHETSSWHSLQLLSVSNTRVIDNRLLTDLNIQLLIELGKR